MPPGTDGVEIHPSVAPRDGEAAFMAALASGYAEVVSAGELIST